MSQNNGLSGELLETTWAPIKKILEEQLHSALETALQSHSTAFPIQADRLSQRLREMNPWQDMGWPETVRTAADALDQAQSALAAMKGERDAFELQFEAQKGRSLTFLRQIQDELTPQLRTAEARIKALEEALRAVSDTSHMTRDRKHYRLPLAVMERVDAVLSESKGEQK